MKKITGSKAASNWRFKDVDDRTQTFAGQEGFIKDGQATGRDTGVGAGRHEEEI